MPAFSITLFGTPAILRNGDPFKIHRRKSRALLYYLAAETDPVPRDRLYDIFWPDSERPAAQQSLRTALHGLRARLDDAIRSEGENLVLSPDIHVDTRTLTAAANTTDLATLENALAAARGRFLEGFYLPDNRAFEAWQTRQEAFFHRLVIRGYVTLSRHHESTGSYHQALEALESGLAVDPLQEDLQRQALKLQVFAGDRAGAVKRYDQLRRLLDEELGMPPMAETRALYDAIITDKLEPPPPAVEAPPHPPAAAPGPPVGSAHAKPAGGLANDKTPPAGSSRKAPAAPGEIPFVGREDELAQMAAAAAKGQFILIEGEAGIGKTRLARTYLEHAGGTALVGAAQELGQNTPLAPILEALRGLLQSGAWPEFKADLDLSDVWRGEAARVLPEFFPEHRPAGRAGAFSTPSQPQDASDARLWEALSQLLQALARKAPLHLFIDDLQWADSTSLAVLDYLLHQNPTGGITFLAATRPPEPRSGTWRLLESQARRGRLARFPLRRLEPGEIRSMFSAIPETDAKQLTDWLVRTSEGNPFVLAELIHDLQADGILQPYTAVDAARLDAETTVPQSVYSILQAALADLSGTARRLLDAAVVVGRSFEPDVAQLAAGISELAALDALEELAAAGLIAPGEGLSYRFAHVLVAEVAWMEAGEPRHRMMHRRVAEALETLHRGRLDEEAGLLAFHFAEGRARQKAAHYAFSAARNAEAVHAWTQAAELYELALAGAPNERQFEIQYGLSRALALAGQAARASEAARAAVRLAEAAGNTAQANLARIQYARSLIPQGRYADIVREVQPVLQTEEMPDVIQAEILWGTARSLEGADLRAGQAHLEHAVALAEQFNEPHLKSQAMFELGNIAAQQGDLDRAVQLFKDALALSEDPNFSVLLRNNLAYHQLLAGDPGARATGLEALAEAEAYGLMILRPYILSTLGEIALAAGEIDEAQGRFEQGLALARQLDNPERIAGLTANLGLAAAAAGDNALAMLNLSNTLGYADDLGLRHLATRVRVWLAPLAPPAKARELLDEAEAIAVESGRAGLLEEIAAARDALTRQ